MYNSAIKVLNKITEFGYNAYIIGGYPRDLYLKRSSLDIDICTDATPMELVNIFNEVVMASSEYGAVVIIVDKVRFEITTFRSEGKYLDFRKPSSIKYIDSLEEDLKRRDFTINTLCIDKDGNEIDLLNAKSDLDNRIIRMVGNPKIRLKEDALRILRAVRFATVLNFELEPVLKAYIKKYAYLVKKLSKERIREELDIIFASSNKEYGIKLLCDLKLADNLGLPELKKIKITPSMIVTWSQLGALVKYNFSTSEKETMARINELRYKNLLDKKVLYKYGLYACTLASELHDVDKKQLNEIDLSLQIHSKLDIALSPMEICEILDKEPGAFLKDLINDLETKLITDEIINTKEALTEYISNQYM
ncbi:MAG: hypothetical protein HFH47_03015 [Bacilli bacterium]|nr:hypothetical protein [Bacilli bacterium]